MQTVEQLLQLGQSLLAKQDNPLFEVQLILAHVLHCEPAHLAQKKEQLIDQDHVQKYETLLQRRLIQEPMAYILGYKDFYGLRFKVTPDTLVPRWDTEMMVRLLLDRAPNKSDYQVADIGTGAGNIGCVLAYHRPSWKITATDISPQALAIAQENAHRLNLANIEFIQSNWLEALADRQFDVIISNPPYIREYDLQLMYGKKLFEPRLSLSIGATGLEGFQHIILQGKRLLKPQGFFIFEHGFDQAQALRQLLSQANLKSIQTFNDLAGREKVTIGFNELCVEAYLSVK